MVHARDAQWERSEQSFRRAIALDPNQNESYDDFAMYLPICLLGRIEEALQELHMLRRRPIRSHRRFIISCITFSIPLAGMPKQAATVKLPADHFAKSACLVAAQLREGKIGEVIPTLEAEFNRGVAKGSWVRSSLGCRLIRRPAAARMQRELQPLARLTISTKPRSSAVWATRISYLRTLWISAAVVGPCSDRPGTERTETGAAS